MNGAHDSQLCFQHTGTIFEVLGNRTGLQNRNLNLSHPAPYSSANFVMLLLAVIDAVAIIEFANFFRWSCEGCEKLNFQLTMSYFFRRRRLQFMCFLRVVNWKKTKGVRNIADFKNLDWQRNTKLLNIQEIEIDQTDKLSVLPPSYELKMANVAEACSLRGPSVAK